MKLFPLYPMLNDPIAIRMVKIVNLDFISDHFVLDLIIIGHEMVFTTSGMSRRT